MTATDLDERQNGNVPIALLRWELLGLTDELTALGIDPKPG